MHTHTHDEWLTSSTRRRSSSSRWRSCCCDACDDCCDAAGAPKGLLPCPCQPPEQDSHTNTKLPVHRSPRDGVSGRHSALGIRVRRCSRSRRAAGLCAHKKSDITQHAFATTLRLTCPGCPKKDEKNDPWPGPPAPPGGAPAAAGRAAGLLKIERAISQRTML